MSRTTRRIVLMLSILAVLGAIRLSAAPTPSVRGAKQTGSRPRAALTAQESDASRLALADPRVQSLAAGNRTELMGVLPVGAQVTEASRNCLERDCSLVQLYDFDHNSTIQAIVDTERQMVLDVLLVAGARPGINARLAERAREIAFNAPEVIEVLGEKPTVSDWNPMDADLNGTSCSGGHFCVAPSFRVGATIMWAFVDLTTEEFVGIRWTSPGPESEQVITYDPNRSPEGLCDPGTISQSGWTVNWETTNTDGLRVYNVSYNGQPLLTSAKLVEWHADYGSNGYVDSTGCSPSGGFPIRPIASAYTEPIVEGGNSVGFAVRQIFSMTNWGASCNYRYEQRFQFFTDGRFRVMSGAYGRGCGSNSLYRPIVRIDFAAAGTPANDSIERWDAASGGWLPVTTESIFPPASVQTNPNRYAYRISDTVTQQGFYVEPGGPHFPTVPAERGDNPFVYIVQRNPNGNEGETDIGAIGTCCNDNVHGPEPFVNQQSTVDQDLVMWYVPQMQTVASPPYSCWTVTVPNDTYPCFSGPMFHPFAPGEAPHAHFMVQGRLVAGLPVAFMNHTTGSAPLTYLWDFGDGSSSTEQEPTHTFADPGSYTVTLTATNASGSDSYSETVVISSEVYLPLVAH